LLLATEGHPQRVGTACFGWVFTTIGNTVGNQRVGSLLGEWKKRKNKEGAEMEKNQNCSSNPEKRGFEGGCVEEGKKASDREKRRGGKSSLDKRGTGGGTKAGGCGKKERPKNLAVLLMW